MYCYHCKNEITIEKVFRQSTCPHCESYLHCCLNCRFYDERASNQCREPQVQLVKNKEMGNFCDYFEPKEELEQKIDRAAEARKKLDDLFKS